MDSLECKKHCHHYQNSCKETPCTAIIEDIANKTYKDITPQDIDKLFAEITRLTEQLEEKEKRFSVPIVCICGSTKFKQAWISENARLTGEGNIVLAVGLWGHHERKYPDEQTKVFLDNLHKRKIDLCDWVWILDVGGYIGESTQSEIAYAILQGKTIRYLSMEFPDYIEPQDQLEAANTQLRQKLEKAEARLKEISNLSNELIEFRKKNLYETCPDCSHGCDHGIAYDKIIGKAEAIKQSCGE